MAITIDDCTILGETRGFEFSTQPFDISNRETADAHDMFGTPTYKPDGFGSVADVTLENGHIQIKDRCGHTTMLNAGRSL